MVSCGVALQEVAVAGLASEWTTCRVGMVRCTERVLEPMTYREELVMYREELVRGLVERCVEVVVVAACLVKQVMMTWLGRLRV